MEKTEKKERDIEKEIEKLANYFVDNFGDEIKDQLGTIEDVNRYHIHIHIYDNSNIIITYEEVGHYSNFDKIDIDLMRVNIYDVYYHYVIKMKLKDADFDDNITEDRAFEYFKKNYDFNKYIKECIEDELTVTQIKYLYNLLFSKE